MKDEFVVIDITTNGLDEDAEIVSFAALRFENGVPTERFFEYVNSGAVLSDSVSEILGITDDTLQRYGTTMEDAYWQFIEFCYDSNLVTMHHDMRSISVWIGRRSADVSAVQEILSSLKSRIDWTILSTSG